MHTSPGEDRPAQKRAADCNPEYPAKEIRLTAAKFECLFCNEASDDIQRYILATSSKHRDLYHTI